MNSSFSILERINTPFSSLSAFSTLLAASLSPEQRHTSEPVISAVADLPSYLAIEFLADCADQEAKLTKENEEKRKEAAAVRVSLFPISAWNYLSSSSCATTALPVSDTVRSDSHEILGVQGARIRIGHCLNSCCRVIYYDLRLLAIPEFQHPN